MPKIEIEVTEETLRMFELLGRKMSFYKIPKEIQGKAIDCVVRKGTSDLFEALLVAVKESAVKHDESVDRGFTLTECVVAMVLAGTIAAMAIPGMGRIIETSKERRIVQDLMTIQASAKIYYAEHGIDAIRPYDGRKNISEVNDIYDINIIEEDDVTYELENRNGTLTASGKYGNKWRVVMTKDMNPKCTSTSCPTVGK